MVLNLLAFLRNLLSSVIDKNRRNLIQSELENTLIDQKTFAHVLSVIESRLKNVEYKIEDCTFELVQKKLMKFKDPLKSMEAISKFQKETNKTSDKS